MEKFEICPSILSANFFNLEKEIENLKKADINVLHIDVMDGHFVPNISFGECVLKSLKNNCDMYFDVHLMVKKPLLFLKRFHKAGAFSLTFHIEADDDAFDCIKEIKSYGCKAAIAVSPKTDIKKVLKFLDYIDMLLIMAVEPGFGGQKFIDDVLYKIVNVKKIKPNLKIQVDGGINLVTAEKAKKAGADYFVVGSFIFSSKDYLKTLKDLQKIICC